MTTSYSKVPADWVAGYTLTGDAGAIANMTTAFPEVAQAEAAHATGDIANLLFGILHRIHALYVGLTVLKPSKWVIAKSDSTDATTGKVTTTFTVQFITSLAVGAQSVDAEA